MSTVRVNGVIINISKMKKDFGDLKDRARKEVEPKAVAVLQEIVDELNSGSSNKRSQARQLWAKAGKEPWYPAGIVDKPFRRAKIKIDRSGGKSRVFVDAPAPRSPNSTSSTTYDLFDLLDTGTKAVSGKRMVTFLYDKRGKIVQRRLKNGEIAGPVVLNFKNRRGTPPRRFYRRVVEQLRKDQGSIRINIDGNPTLIAYKRDIRFNEVKRSRK